MNWAIDITGEDIEVRMAIDITVNVDRKWLIDTLTVNRNEHRGIYEKAYTKYAEAYVAWLSKQLDEINKNPKRVEAGYFQAARPEDHTDDYNLVISMLENSSEETIEVTGSDYRRFVQDNWEWTEQFASTSNAYGVQSKYSR